MCGLVGVGCTKHEPPAPPAAPGPRKPRVDVTVWLDPRGEVPGATATSVTLATDAPPETRQMLERGGLHLAILGLPKGADAGAFLEKAVPEAEAAGSNATIVVSTGCLADLAPVLQKNVAPFWTVALVVGAGCGGKVKAAIGAAALVEAGQASRVRITFDRHTRAFLKVEPIR